MTPQEKMRYFWSMGELPGSIFNDLNDQKLRMPEQPRHRQTKRLHLDSWKRRKEASMRNESRIGLERND